MHPVDERQILADKEHLRLLALFMRIYGGITMLISLCFVPHLLASYLFMGGFQLRGGRETSIFGVLFFAIVIGAIVLLLTLGTLHFVAASYLERRRGWLFICILAGISCLSMPLGTALGVFTLIVLNRDSVRRQFEGATPPPFQ